MLRWYTVLPAATHRSQLAHPATQTHPYSLLITTAPQRVMIYSGRVGRIRRWCRVGLKDRPVRAHLLSHTPGRLRYRTIMSRPMVPVAQQRMINSPDRGEVAQDQPGIATRTTATAVEPRTRLRADDSSDDNADDHPAPAALCESWLRRRSQSRAQACVLLGVKSPSDLVIAWARGLGMSRPGFTSTTAG